MQDDYQDDFEDGGISKSQVKREMTALQELGEKLLTFSTAMLEKCELPDVLLNAIEDYLRIGNKHGAKRRQLQYIGKLMRTLDETAIERIHEQLNQNVDLEKRRFHQLEELRDRLIDGDREALESLITAHPELNIQQLRQLIRQAGREREQNQTPVSARKLFRQLRELQSEED